MAASVLLSRVEPLESRVFLSSQPAGAPFQVNSQVPSWFSTASVAADAEGNFVVLWSVVQEVEGVLNHSLLKGRLYSAAGIPRGEEFFVSYSDLTQINPDVAMDASGNFVVVWQRDQPDNGDIFARRFSADGQPLGDQFWVNTFTTRRQVAPNIAMDADGDFVVIWESQDDRAGPLSNYDVYARRYNSAGQPESDEFRINQHWYYRQQGASISMNGQGEFIVVWEDWDLGALMVRSFDATGQPSSDEFVVARPATPPGPNVALHADGGFVVTWDEDGADGDASGVLVQVYNRDLTARTAPFLVNTLTTGMQWATQVAASADGSFVVTWLHSDEVPGPPDIYVREFDAKGTPQGNQFLAHAPAPFAHWGGTVGMNADGDFVVVWENLELEWPYAHTGVFGQRFARLPIVTKADFGHDASSQGIALTFSEDVNASLSPSDLRLVNLTTGEMIDPAAITLAWDAETFTASFSFPGFRDGVLPDGNYRATIAASDVTDPGGNAMQQDAVLEFFVLAGDANRDRKVDIHDLGILATNWQASPRTFSLGDFNYDMVVDITDLGILATNWQQQLAPPSAPFRASRASVRTSRLIDQMLL